MAISGVTYRCTYTRVVVMKNTQLQNTPHSTSYMYVNYSTYSHTVRAHADRQCGQWDSEKLTHWEVPHLTTSYRHQWQWLLPQTGIIAKWISQQTLHLLALPTPCCFTSKAIHLIANQLSLPMLLPMALPPHLWSRLPGSWHWRHHR